METKTCKRCELPFMPKDKRQIFCSRRCSATFNNIGRRRHGNAPRKCPGCGSTTVPGSVTHTRYCSKICRQEHEVRLWLIGEIDGCWKYTHAAYVRRYLESRSGGSCELCGFNQVRSDGSSVLQVDHVDGNWRNNTVVNVRLICPNCHALTDNFGARNMGNGRTWKNKYNQFRAISSTVEC